MSSPVVNICLVCEQPINAEDGEGDVLHNYTDEPCAKCQKEIKEGNFLFVLISDKSTDIKINRLHHTWVVERKDVIEEYGSLDQFDGEQIVFIPESEAMKVGLLEQRITDPETGIRYDQMENEDE